MPCGYGTMQVRHSRREFRGETCQTRREEDNVESMRSHVSDQNYVQEARIDLANAPLGCFPFDSKRMCRG